ncbi:DNA-(apurinic or apyrimidinic site) lyase [Mycoplasma testudineum]|uniref:DNA-(Apurinic or apyrimidinic site) lyase n=1 Tax=Mycoplasma testudineum TaxID=244584 RepID=A0A4R6ICU1_9MOLU|nr:DNA-formamidopyrimidine glycosylase [Mycoplasma testudineum]OYD26722.1 DNA-formamidopyrimidine glycosylase [Mycoplasma testudineum]TDO19802.1 DNA-(apurinic or apyrimidinic site) lyase [Mycoplasma testudineum]
MPELPEVRVNAKALNDTVKNKVVKSIKVWMPKLIKEISEQEFINSLIGKKITKVDNRAKFLVFHFSDSTIMLSHLRMSGQYFYYSAAPLFLETNVHIIWYFSDGSELHYKDPRQFGTFHIRTNDNYLKIKPLVNVAPIPANVDIDVLYSKMKKSSRAIKTFLLDQSNVAGLGNIYVNEALWDVKVHPSIEAKNISKLTLKKIIDSSTRILDKSTALGGSTIDTYASLNQKEGNYQNFLQVHGKDKHLCSRCGTEIEKYYVNGRSTYFCLNEQI